MVLSIGTILGCLVLPPLAERLGRRLTLGLYFVVMFFSIAVGFGYIFYLPNALAPFFAVLFFLGVGGANFAMYTLWLPEQYSTECRASAFAFATSVGRFAGAGITFLVGAGVAHFHTIGTPVALTSIAFLIGLLLLPFGEETRGQVLPEPETPLESRHEVNRGRLDRRDHRRARRQLQFVPRPARDQRVERKPAVQRHPIDRSFGRDRDDACGEMVARAGLARRARFERDVFRANARVDGGADRDRLAFGDVQHHLADRHLDQAAR